LLEGTHDAAKPDADPNHTEKWRNRAVSLPLCGGRRKGVINAHVKKRREKGRGFARRIAMGSHGHH